ncbi:PD-(D/E)XK nuclease family protein, partial [Actinomycetota bacterium]|nr:PD-(D/E)XK nuclease family protein [Actinomycetota bacterium]
MTCPLLYRLRVIDKLPERPSAAALRGTLVHSVLEELFTMSAAQRTADTATTLIAQHWERMRVEAPEDAEILAEGINLEEPTDIADAVIAPIRPLLEAYFTLEDPRRVEPHARE